MGHRPHPRRRVAGTGRPVCGRSVVPAEQPGRRAARRRSSGHDRRPAPDARRRNDERPAARVRDHRGDRAASRARERAAATARARGEALAGVADPRRRGRSDDPRRRAARDRRRLRGRRGDRGWRLPAGRRDPLPLSAHRVDACRPDRRCRRRHARPRRLHADEGRRGGAPAHPPLRRRRGGRCSDGRGRAQPRCPARRVGLRRRHRAAPDPAGARVLRRRRRPRPTARACDASDRAAHAPPLADAASRRARTRPRAVAHSGQLRVHHRRAGIGPLRGRLSRDARPRRGRPGGVRRPARLHGQRGLEARAAPRRGAATRLCAHSTGRARLSGRPCERHHSR